MTLHRKNKDSGKSWSGRSKVQGVAGLAPNLLADEELVAVIMAAITAFSGNQVTVKHIKRMDSSPNWVSAGRRAGVAMRQI